MKFYEGKKLILQFLGPIGWWFLRLIEKIFCHHSSKKFFTVNLYLQLTIKTCQKANGIFLSSFTANG